MSQRPWDYNNDIQPGTETISDDSKKKIIGLGYENWLKVQQSQGSYTDPISYYHPSTVKEFLIYYRRSEQKKWEKERHGSQNQVSEFRFRGQGYEALDGNTYAKNNILYPYNNYSDDNIKSFDNARLESFINRVYENKNRTFNDVNKVDSHRVSTPLKVSYWLLSIISSPLSFLYKGNEDNGPLRQAPRAPQDPQSLRRAQSLKFNYRSPNHENQSFSKDLRKRKGSDQQDSGPDQGHPKRTKSAGGSSYFDAFKSGNKNQLERAESLRFEQYKKEEERREAERKRKEEEKAKQKAKKPRQPQRASSFPSQSPGQIQKSLFGPDGRLQRASTMQSSPLTRINSQQPLRNGGVNNRRPSSDPVQPLTARQVSSRLTGIGAPPPRHRQP